MDGRPDLERIPQLKRDAHRIFAKYDPNPANALFQHMFIRDLMANDYGEPDNDNQESAGCERSGST
jgi:hypothetical protein